MVEELACLLDTLTRYEVAKSQHVGKLFGLSFSEKIHLTNQNLIFINFSSINKYLSVSFDLQG